MENFNELFDRAVWIAPADRDVFPVIRATFSLDNVPAQSVLHIIGFGGYIAYLNGHRVSEDLFLPLNTDFDGNELLLSDVLGTSADAVYGDIESNAEKEQLKEALKKLTDRERKIMFLRFGLGGGEEMTQKDVADLLGISQSYISRLEKKIILRLKKEIAKME